MVEMCFVQLKFVVNQWSVLRCLYVDSIPNSETYDQPNVKVETVTKRKLEKYHVITEIVEDQSKLFNLFVNMACGWLISF